jgi:hypothetical protein
LSVAGESIGRFVITSAFAGVAGFAPAAGIGGLNGMYGVGIIAGAGGGDDGAVRACGIGDGRSTVRSSSKGRRTRPRRFGDGGGRTDGGFALAVTVGAGGGGAELNFIFDGMSSVLSSSDIESDRWNTCGLSEGGGGRDEFGRGAAGVGSRL